MSETRNYLLNSFSAPTREAIFGLARKVDLPVHTPLAMAGKVPESLFFLTAGAASSVVRMRNGGSAEVCMCGVEGVVGAAALMGPLPAQFETFMQLPGEGLAVETGAMRTLFAESQEVRCAILRFLQVQMLVIQQRSGCKRLHEAEARLASWLLTASDVSQSEKLLLKQEFLAQMLGSQRTTVAVIAGNLQRLGLVDYSRGNLRILNRDGLEAVACECYDIVRSANATLFGSASGLA